jgi:hypothetical protein
MFDGRLTDPLTEAEEAVRAMLSQTGDSQLRSLRKYRLDEFCADPAFGAEDGDTLELRIEFGRTRLNADEANGFALGSVVSLDATIDEPAELVAAGRTIGRGEPVVIDGKIGVRVTELFGRQEATP